VNQGKTIVVLIVAAAVAASGGYWAGKRAEHKTTAQSGVTAAPGGVAAKEHKILYYRNPMGLPDTSPTPKKDPMGMEYVPVYEGGDTEAATGDPAAA